MLFNILHLLWIVPLSASVGYVIGAIMATVKD